jgi:hypothetical protein
LSHNPTFFKFRKGKAILDSVRMGGRFFSLGVFRAEGVTWAGNQAVLRQRYEAPYYQPLPKERRNPNGNYSLTPVKDGRFWSKLDFPHRQMSNVQVLDQKVTVVEKQGAFELHIEVAGHNRVPYAVELAFRPGGQFTGALQESPMSVRAGSDQGRVLLLKEGMGRLPGGRRYHRIRPGTGGPRGHRLFWTHLPGARGCPADSRQLRLYRRVHTFPEGDHDSEWVAERELTAPTTGSAVL